MGVFGNIWQSIKDIHDPRYLVSRGEGAAKADYSGMADEMKKNGFAPKTKPDDILVQGQQQALDFANQGQAGYGALGAEAAESRGMLRDQAMGKNSLSAEQLRQGLQQQQAQMQSMAQGGPASSAPMGARTAMIGAGRASSAMAGNAAMAGVAERNAAQQAWANAILGARGQDLQATLGSRNTATGRDPTKEPGWWDKYGGAVMGGAAIAACDERLKTDVADASADVDAMLDALKPVEFRYADPAKHGEGVRTGIMAQDLAATEAGARLVIDTRDGLMVNLPHTVVALLAITARLNERIRALEAEKAA